MLSVNSPFKVLVSDLEECEINEKGVCSLAVKSQQTQQIRKINFESVWLQGRIDDRPDNDTLLLNDGTGKGIIQPLSSMEQDKSWISKGIPCLVLGTLIGQSPVTVKPFKIASLQNNVNHEDSWPLEVEELKFVVSNETIERFI